jgi:hypothetical protein
MSVYIHNMEMPQNCYWCPLRASCVHRIYLEERPDDCPLVHVPPHGDLIDRDALFKEMEQKGWYDNADRDIAEDLVLDAPIIIEGEEE